MEALNPERSLARTPVFQVGFALQNVPFPAWTGGGLSVEPMPADAGTAKFDLELLLTEEDDNVQGRLEYSLDLFDEATAQRIAQYFQRVLVGVAARPEESIGRLPLLDETEHREVLALGDGGRREWPGAGLIHQCFETQARATPEAEAVRFEGASLTYAELDRRDRIRAMAADPSLVTSMEDHRYLYGNPAVFSRLWFLTGSGRVRRLLDMARVAPRADLSGDLCEVVGRYRDSGLDVIVIDQTTTEHRAGGFACVKVIIPGTLPMTFGHTLRRADGLPRLREVPRLLGYRTRPLRSRDVNPHPHPFP